MPGRLLEPITDPETVYPATFEAVRTNLVPNPSFETGIGSYLNYDAVYSATSTWTRPTTSPAVGGSSLRITVNTLGDGAGDFASFSAIVGSTTPYPSTDSDAFVFSAWVRGTTGSGRSAYVRAVRWTTGAGGGMWGTAQDAYTNFVLTSTTDWTRISVVLPRYSGGDVYGLDLRVGLRRAFANVNDWVEIDGVMLEKTSSPGVYFDGSSPGARWDGTAHQSSSHTFPERRRTNSIPNPSFEGDTLNAAPSLAVVGWDANWSSTLGQVQSGWAALGSRSLRITGTHNGTTTPGWMFVNFSMGGPNGMRAVTPGTPYSFSCYLNILNATDDLLAIGFNFWNDAVPTGQFSGTGANFNGATGLQRLTVSGVVPDGKFYVQPLLMMWTDVANDVVDFYADCFLWEDTPTVGAYFDGSSPASWWEGNAHASTSGGPVGGVRRNLESNPSYETSIADLQQIQATGSVSRVASAEAQSGGYVARQVCPGTNGAEGFHAGNTAWATQRGKTYTITARVKGTAGRNLALRLWDSGATDGSFVTTGGWQIVSTTRTAPDLSMFYAFLTGSPQVVTFDVDWVIVEEGSAYGGSYADGDTPGYNWDGTPHASQSRAATLVIQDGRSAWETDLLLPTSGRVVSGHQAALLLESGFYQSSP